MAETYSLAVTGCSADSTQDAKVITLPDSACQRKITEKAHMRTGAQILCLNPDGSQSWYVIDAELSTNALPQLRRV